MVIQMENTIVDFSPSPNTLVAGMQMCQMASKGVSKLGRCRFPNVSGHFLVASVGMSGECVGIFVGLI